MLRSTISLCFLLLLNVSYSQNVITQVFKPGPNIGQDAALLMMDNQCIPSSYNLTPEFLNFGNTPDLAYGDWTFNALGCPHGTLRSIIKFDQLNSIPSNAIIIDAHLRLYGVNDGDFVPQGNSYYPGSPYPNSNEGQLYRISSGITNSWDEQTVTWNSAENLSLDANPISIPPSSSQWGWNYSISGPVFIQMVQSMLGTGNNNGFLLKLQLETHYRSVVFASSNHPDPKLWPELIIKYMLPCDASFTYSVNTSNPYNYNFTANSTNALEYQWNINGSYVSSGQNLNYDFPGPGNYSICLFIADNEQKCESCYELCIGENKEWEYAQSVINNQPPKTYLNSSKAIKGDIHIWTTENNQLKLHPNPTKDTWNLELTVEESEQVTIKLLDLSGRLFYQRKEHLNSGNNKLELTSDGLSSGAYILEIQGENIAIREKVIKK